MSAPRTDDCEMDLAMHDWLHEDDGPMPHRSRAVDRIMDRVDETGQRGRWWPLVPVSRPAPGAQHHRRGTWLPAASAVVVVVAVAAIYLASFVRPVYAPGSAQVDPADRAVMERMGALWAGSPSEAEVATVYAEDAVHTSLWTNKAERFVGPREIARRIRLAVKLEPMEQEVFRLPDTKAGAHRYLSVRPEFGGMPCVAHVADDRIARHDCILPMASGQDPFVLGEPPVGVERAAVAALINEAWSGDRAAFDAVVSPEIVHLVAFEDGAVARDGLERYWAVISMPGDVTSLMPAVDLLAPEGELRWVDYSDVGGGSLCTFWVRGNELIRHDCVVPTSST